MSIPIDAYLMWFAAFFYLLAAAYLVVRIKKDKLEVLYPISIYLGSIAAFFILMGISMIFPSQFIVAVASLAIMFGASTIVRFPLKLELPGKEKTIYAFLLILTAVLATLAFSTGNPDVMLKTAHFYAFVVAGLFTIGYLLYMGLKMNNPALRMKSVSVGTSLGLCCVFAHGLAASQLLPLFSVSLLGVFTLNAPMIFALISPLAFIFVLLISKFLWKGG